MQQATYLHHEPRALLDQVVSMARDGLQRLVHFTNGQGGQTVAVDRGMKDRFQVVIVGFLVRVQRPAVMIGREPTLIVGDGLDPTLPDRFGGGNIHFEAAAIDIEVAARECDVALLNASHGTTAHMLLAGKPALMLPLTLEHTITATRVEQLGAGISVPFFDGQELQASLNAIFTMSSYKRSAEQFAERYAQWSFDKQATEIAERIEALLTR